MLGLWLAGSGCPEDNRSVPSDAGAGLDAARTDAAAAPDADTIFTCVAPDSGLSPAVEALGADLRAGRLQCLVRSFACGEPFTVEDLAHMDWPAGYTLSECDYPAEDLAADLRRLEASRSAGRVRIDTAKQAACKALGADGGVPLVDDLLVAGCRDLVVGLVQPGGACTYDLECVGGRCRLETAGACQGTCVAVPQPAEGEPCGGEIECGRGSYCQPTGDGGSSGVCRKTPALGEACSSLCATVSDAGAQFCIDFCPTGSSCLQGTCSVPPEAEVGEPCGYQVATCKGTAVCNESGRCEARAAEGETCDPEDSRCGPCLKCDATLRRCVIHGAGAPCAAGVDAGLGTIDLNMLPYYCAPSGRYEAKPRTGEACLDAVGCLYKDDYCRAGDAGEGVCTRKPGVCESCKESHHACLAGNCDRTRQSPYWTPDDEYLCFPGAEGDPCSWANDCAPGLACAEGRCGPRLAAGASCGEDADCGPGLFCAADVDGGQTTCQARRLEGATCTADRQCLSGVCSTEQGTCTGGPCDECEVEAPLLFSSCTRMVGFDFIGYFVFFAAVLVRRRREPPARLP